MRCAPNFMHFVDQYAIPIHLFDFHRHFLTDLFVQYFI